MQVSEKETSEFFEKKIQTNRNKNIARRRGKLPMPNRVLFCVNSINYQFVNPELINITHSEIGYPVCNTSFLRENKFNSCNIIHKLSN